MRVKSVLLAWLALGCLTPRGAIASDFVDGMWFGFEPQATDRGVWQETGERHLFLKQEQLAAALVEALPGSRIIKRELKTDNCRKNGIYVRAAKGEVWHIGFDEQMIEVRPPRMRLREVESKLAPLYAAFRKVGLSTLLPAKNGLSYGTSAAIHVDKQLFVKNPLLLRNLLVEIHNRPYLASIFRWFGDHRNANSVWERGEQDRFLLAIKAVDQQAAAKGRYDYAELLRAIEPLFRHVRDRDVNLVNLWTQRERPDAPPTIEFRMMTGQRSPSDMADQARFLGTYLKHLNGLRQPVAPRRFADSKEVNGERSPSVARARMLQIAQTIGLPKDTCARLLSNRFLPPFRVQSEGSGKPPVTVRLFDRVTGFAATSPEQVGEHVEFRSGAKVARLEVKGWGIPTLHVELQKLPGKARSRVGQLQLPSLGRHAQGGVPYQVTAYDRAGRPVGETGTFEVRYRQRSAPPLVRPVTQQQARTRR